ncbi:MAG: TIGR00375 family protein [Candidatus Aenigmarchaeota archaeon]|nr:TIGR00375 family protein [Candidatus Aenigmarchaeota archaeon]
MDYVEVNADLHLHGLYSGGVSKNMIPRVIGEQAPLKGLGLVGTGDILNGRWLELVKRDLKSGTEGILEHPNGTKFILQTEVEDNKRVHHIILVPSFSKVEELIEKFKRHVLNLDTDGRPRVHLNGEEIAEICIESGCLIGPAHAFTPWTALFKEYNSLKECYGKYDKRIYFLELGLSADTDMADRIKDLHRLTFLSNSDAHSPWPNKMGREFNRLRVKEISFKEIEKSLKRENGRKVILNTGLNPKEGKYHKTRCISCLLFFEPEDAGRYNWKCPNCGKPIKKGVDNRINELADLEEGKHPEHRPSYVHTIPLSEIISLSLGVKNVYSIKVQAKWEEFVKEFGNEIKILLETDFKELQKADAKVAEMIKAFRENRIQYIPGGGGVYGKILPPGKKPKIEYYKFRQKCLSDY